MVLACELDGNGEPIKKYEFENSFKAGDGYTVLMQAYGDSLYIVDSRWSGTGDDQTQQLELMRWDLDTRELETLFSGPADFAVREFYVTDSDVLFSDSYSGKIYAYDLDGGEVSVFLDMNVNAMLSIGNGIFVGQVRNEDDPRRGFFGKDRFGQNV